MGIVLGLVVGAFIICFAVVLMAAIFLAGLGALMSGAADVAHYKSKENPKN